MSGFTRRSFLASAASMAALEGLPSLTRAQASPSDAIVLEDARLRAVFDRKYGSLLTLENKQTGWRIQDRSEFGAGFRLHVPLPERGYHFISEKGNPVNHTEWQPGANEVAFVWRELRSSQAGTLDITLRTKVVLHDGALTISTDLDNRSKLTIDSLAYPILGDISIPGGDKGLSQGSWGYSGMNTSQLYPNFSNGAGYFGTDHPMQSAVSPWALFILIFSSAQGLYVGCHDATVQDMVRYQVELEPGYADSLTSGVEDSAFPKESSRINLQLIQFPFAHHGQRKVSPPIVLRPYQGSWHQGVDIYKQWRKTWFTPPVSPAWVKEVHSWQQIQINSSEDRLLFPYSKLVDYGKDCARHGVKAIQLTGWNQGGQDRGNPSHDTDPRLGTADDLRHAIEACRQMGVEVILFNKYAWADPSTEWYRKELYRYAARNPYGDTYTYEGYAYDTPVQYSQINIRHQVGMCSACPAWREIAYKEFHKSVELKAGGILQDEAGWHGPGARYCFSPDHRHPVPTFIFSGDLPLAEGFRKQIDPEHFLMSAEAPWDSQSQYYTLGYTRIDGAVQIPLQRYIDPHKPIMIAATGWNDRQMINRALLYRYVISYEPFNFKGRLDDFPLTIEYGKTVDAPRLQSLPLGW